MTQNEDLEEKKLLGSGDYALSRQIGLLESPILLYLSATSFILEI
jgi:hypothetical protein